MPSFPDQHQALTHLLAQSASTRQRLLEMAAREHVGVAALNQSTAVEEIIAAGREQIEVTAALQGVLQQTLEQLREGGRVQTEVEPPDHSGVLHRILEVGQAQRDIAALMSNQIVDALERVTRIPVEDISLTTLRTVQRTVQAEIKSFRTLVGMARQQVTTRQDLDHLDRIERDLNARLGHLRHAEAIDKVRGFEQLAEEAVSNIMRVANAEIDDQIRALQVLVEHARRMLAGLREP
ncbi:hypothetical protein [Deinococcus sonorensis]|uniref:PhoU family transcriptional regulator n=2 Tax=Deinococcus sonorensis TaxID=309891 RepID=A0AAU7U753_9DEIO